MTENFTTDSKPMDFTPQPVQQPVVAPSYELKKDVTGKAPIRGIVLTDKNGNKVQLPFPAKENCKKCYGRGYIGFVGGNNPTTKGKFIICHKCYPLAFRN